MKIEINNPKEFLELMNAAKKGLHPSGRGSVLDPSLFGLVESLEKQVIFEEGERRCMNCDKRVEWNNGVSATDFGWIHVSSRAYLCYSVNPVATPYPLEETT